MAGDVSSVSAIDEPITAWSIWASHHPIVLDRCGESRSSRCYCCSVGTRWRIATLLAQAVLGCMPLLLAMKALPEIFLFLIILVISLILSLMPLWTFAASTGVTGITTITTFATLLCKEQSFRRDLILSLDCSCLFDELGDNLIGHGGHHGVFVHHVLREDFPLVVPWDSAKEVEYMLLLTRLGDCRCRVHIGISVSGRWPSADIGILDFPIDPLCIVVDISTVLLLDAQKVFSNLEDVELQVWLVGWC